MNFYALNIRNVEWVLLSTNVINNYKEQTEKLILSFQNDKSIRFIFDNTPPAFIYKFDNDSYTYERFKEIFLFLHLKDSLTQDFLLSTFYFQQTEDDCVVRYQCQHFPFILDCVYDEQANLINAVILSYSDSTAYFFNPKIFPELISMFVFDDIYGIDFFYDVDVSLVNRKSLQLIDKEIVTLLKANASKIPSICNLKDVVNKSFDDIISEFDHRSIDKFNASMRKITTSSFVKRHFSCIFFCLSFITLITVFVVKLNLITYIKLLINNF